MKKKGHSHGDPSDKEKAFFARRKVIKGERRRERERRHKINLKKRRIESTDRVIRK